MRLLPLLLGLATVGCDSGKPTAQSSSTGTEPRPAWVADLPRVVRTPALLADSEGLLLIATPQGIVVEGKSIVALDRGAVAAEDKEGGAQGQKITRLATLLAGLQAEATKSGRPAGPLQVAMERTLSYRLLLEILFTAKQKDVGFKQFHVLVTDGHAPLAIPLTLPDTAAMAAVVPDAGPISAPQGRGPSSRVRVDESSGGGSSLTPDAVIAKILSAYMTGVKHCYQTALKRDATLTGKLKLTLTVDETGRSVKTEAKGFDREIDECVGGKMSSWRFPIPKDKDGQSVSATFSITLQLIIDEAGAAAKQRDSDTADREAAAKLAGELKEEVKTQAYSLPGETYERPAPVMQNPDTMPLGLVVSITKDTLVVWSISGMEGTLSQPRLSVALTDPTAMKQLNALVLEIVTRRWQGRDRPPATKSIIVMADSATSMQTVADAFVAVRSTVDGATLLFPDIQLAARIE